MAVQTVGPRPEMFSARAKRAVVVIGGTVAVAGFAYTAATRTTGNPVPLFAGLVWAIALAVATVLVAHRLTKQADGSSLRWYAAFAFGVLALGAAFVEWLGTTLAGDEAAYREFMLTGRGYWRDSNGFFRQVRWLHAHLGWSPIHVRLLNVAAVVVTAAFLVRMARRCNVPVRSHTLFLLITLVPLTGVWAIALHREAPMMLCVAVIVVSLTEPRLVVRWSLFAAAFGYLLLLRPVLAVTAGGAVMVGEMVRRRSVHSTLIVLLGVAVLFVGGFIQSLSEDTVRPLAENLPTFEATGHTRGLGTDLVLQQSSGVAAVLRIPSSVLIPTPMTILGNSGSDGLLLTLWGATTYIGLPLVVMGLTVLPRMRRELIPAASVVLFVGVGSGLTYLSQVSDPARFRSPVVPVAIVIAVQGWAARHQVGELTRLLVMLIVVGEAAVIFGYPTYGLLTSLGGLRSEAALVFAGIAGIGFLALFFVLWRQHRARGFRPTAART